MELANELPLLWILVVNMILKEFELIKIKTVCYADDIVIILKGKHLNIVSDLMNEALKRLKSWCLSCGLNINATKTELVFFTRKTAIPKFKVPSMDGKKLELSQSAKYLGLILDSKLN